MVSKTASSFEIVAKLFFKNVHVGRKLASKLIIKKTKRANRRAILLAVERQLAS